MKILNRNLASEIDKISSEDFGISSIHLMESAGKIVADIVNKDFSKSNEKRAGVICGPGNNGGDGFVSARLLYTYGWRVEVFLLSQIEKYKNAALENLKILLNLGRKYPDKIKIVEAADNSGLVKEKLVQLRPDVIIDAIFGVGLTRPIDDLIGEVIALINDSNIAPVYSIDIPSGISTDTGEVLGKAIKAKKTITFTAPKVGHLLYPGKAYSGELIIEKIGVPSEIIESHIMSFYSIKELKPYIKLRDKDSHKGNYGRVIVVGGSKMYIGALSLSTAASIRTGTGLTYAAYKESLKQQFTSTLPVECIHIPIPVDDRGLYSDSSLETLINLPLRGNSIFLVGPGIGRERDTIDFVKKIYLNCDGIIIFDADALFAIKEIINEFNHKAKLILTPHTGEMSYLTGLKVEEIKRNQIEIASNYAKSWHCIIVLKSASTIVASEEGEIYINNFGNPGMAKGGSGDVLSGIIASFLAQGYTSFDASVMGCAIHSIAGDIAKEDKTEWSLTPKDLIEFIPRAFKEIID